MKNGDLGARATYELRLQARDDTPLLSQWVHFEFLGKMEERMNVDTTTEQSDKEMARNLARLKEIVETRTASGKEANRPTFT